MREYSRTQKVLSVQASLCAQLPAVRDRVFVSWKYLSSQTTLCTEEKGRKCFCSR